MNLSAPIEENFARFLANRQVLISATFLADSYVYNTAQNNIIPVKGLALTGSKLAYTVKEKPFYKATIQLQKDVVLDDELQCVIYFFS